MVTNGKKSSEENTQKTSKIWSSAMKEPLQDNPYPSKYDQSKPNKRESQIGQILTDAKIRFMLILENTSQMI